MMSGLEAQTLTTFQQQMEQNHAPKTLFFGDIKTAVAKEGTDVKYEVVYIDMVSVKRAGIFIDIFDKTLAFTRFYYS